MYINLQFLYVYLMLDLLPYANTNMNIYQRVKAKMPLQLVHKLKLKGVKLTNHMDGAHPDQK